MWVVKNLSRLVESTFSTLTNKNIPSIQRQLLLTYYIYVVGITTGLIANLAGYTGPQETAPKFFNSCYLVLTIILAILYGKKKIKLHKAFGGITLATHIFTCNEMLVFATTPNDYATMLILGNVVILVTNTMFAMFFYLKKLPFILSSLSTITYIACTIMTNNSHLKEFSIVVIIVFIVIAILGNLLAKNTHELNYENKTLKEDDEALQEVLKMEKEQIQAYIELAKQRHEHIETSKLLELLSDEARVNIIVNVKEALAAKDMANNNLAEAFPELTTSEREICGLIIHDKKINEISSILKKSESNITCQRTNIRKKLGLQPKDNLREALKSRFKDYSEKKDKEANEKFRLKQFRRDKGI